MKVNLIIQFDNEDALLDFVDENMTPDVGAAVADGLHRQGLGANNTYIARRKIPGNAVGWLTRGERKPPSVKPL